MGHISTSITGGRPRVVSISHSAVRRNAARLRYEALANDPDFDLTLVVPRLWHEAGRAQHAQTSETALDVRIEAARLTRGGPAKWYLHHYPRLGALLTELRPDVIHLWEEPWSVVAAQAARLRDRLLPHAALVLETDQNIWRKLPAGFEHIRQYTIPRTDLMIARGPEALDVVRRSGYSGAAEFVEYGIDSHTFFPRDVADVPSVPLRIGYVGRLVPEKGLDDVLAALRLCPAPVEFTMLGDGPERAGLLARAEAQGLADRVHILPPTNPDGVAEFMATQHALVLMSKTTRTWKEQFGRVIMEAHACGTPVIGSSSGSIPKVVGGGGWIVPEGNAHALAACLGRLAQSPAEIASARQTGLAEVHSRFAFPIVAGALRRAWMRSLSIRRGVPA